jgi:hypothetical protein
MTHTLHPDTFAFPQQLRDRTSGAESMLSVTEVSVTEVSAAERPVTELSASVLSVSLLSVTAPETVPKKAMIK